MLDNTYYIPFTWMRFPNLSKNWERKIFRQKDGKGAQELPEAADPRGVQTNGVLMQPRAKEQEADRAH